MSAERGCDLCRAARITPWYHEDEIRIALALLGVDRWAVLDASYLHPAPPVTLPSITSAFPLLDGADY